MGLYEQAMGIDSFDAFAHGRDIAYQNKVNQSRLADIARADQARPLMGEALQGNAGAMSRLAQLDPNAYLDVGKYQQGQQKQQAELSQAEQQQIAGVLYAADTKEKWDSAINYLRQTGHEVDPHEADFNNRDHYFGAQMGVEGQVKQNNADRTYSIQQQNAETTRMNAVKNSGQGGGFNLPAGATRYNPDGTVLATAPSKPVQPRALTSVDKNAILEADNQVMVGNNTIDLLKQALKLNDKAGTGYMAGAQAFAARNDPTGFFDAEKGAATTEFNNIVAGQALSSMKAIFGGNPTEGERAILLQLQGMADKTPIERKAILDRGIEFANRRVEFNKERAKEIRSGSYFGGASTVDPQQDQGGQGNGGDSSYHDTINTIPDGATFVDETTGQAYRMENGQPVAVQ